MKRILLSLSLIALIMNSAVAHVHIESEPCLGKHPEPVQSGLGSDELIAVKNVP